MSRKQQQTILSSAGRTSLTTAPNEESAARMGHALLFRRLRFRVRPGRYATLWKRELQRSA